MVLSKRLFTFIVVCTSAPVLFSADSSTSVARSVVIDRCHDVGAVMKEQMSSVESLQEAAARALAAVSEYNSHHPEDLFKEEDVLALVQEGEDLAAQQEQLTAGTILPLNEVIVVESADESDAKIHLGHESAGLTWMVLQGSE